MTEQETSDMNRFELAEYHRMEIFNLLKEKGMLTRGQVCQLMDLPATTSWDHLNWLLKNGFIEKFSIPDGKSGRPRTFWRAIIVSKEE